MSANNTREGVFQKISSGITWLSQWVLLFMAVIIFYDVAMRYVFNMPTSWVMEISEYLLVFLAFAGAAGIQKRKSHIRMDYFYNKMPETVRIYVDLLLSLCTVGFASVLIWTSARMVITAYKYESLSNSILEIPLYLPYAMVPLCMLLLMLQGVADMTRVFKKRFLK